MWMLPYYSNLEYVVAECGRNIEVFEAEDFFTEDAENAIPVPPPPPAPSLLVGVDRRGDVVLGEEGKHSVILLLRWSMPNPNELSPSPLPLRSLFIIPSPLCADFEESSGPEE